MVGRPPPPPGAVLALRSLAGETPAPQRANRFNYVKHGTTELTELNSILNFFFPEFCVSVLKNLCALDCWRLRVFALSRKSASSIFRNSRFSLSQGPTGPANHRS